MAASADKRHRAHALRNTMSRGRERASLQPLIRDADEADQEATMRLAAIDRALSAA